MMTISFAMGFEVQAQRIITTTEVLSELAVDSLNVFLDSSIDFLKNTNQKMPLVEKYEIRTETDELDISAKNIYLEQVSPEKKKEKFKSH